MDSVLRDLDRERSKMQSDMENLNRHYEQLCSYVRKHVEQSTVEWAKLVVNHPQALLLVVETTRIVDESGYATDGWSEPIRFTMLSLASGEMWDQLLSPTHSKGVEGTEYHGLTLEDLEGEPRIADVWPNIKERLDGRHVIIFGADWVRDALRSVGLFGLDGAFCLHNKVKEYYGEFYDLSLEKVLSYQGIEKKREDLKDSQMRILMLAQVVNNLAAGMKKNQVEQSESGALDDDGDELGDLDDHPF